LTLWSLIKVQGLTDAESPTECNPETERPTRLFLKDLDTGEVVVINTCKTIAQSACDMLLNLGSAGYTPNDWDDECSPE